MMVFARAMTSAKSARLAGPESRPSQPAGMPSLSVAAWVFASGSKLVGDHEVDGQMNLHPFGRSLVEELFRDLCAFRVEEGLLPISMPSRTFLKVKGHAAADDDLVGLV